MEKQNENELGNGLYVKGVVISHSARTGLRKDGSGRYVSIDVELATQPGLVKWSSFYDPDKADGVKVEGDKVIEYPHPNDFEPVLLKVERHRTDKDGTLIIMGAERIA